MTIKAKKWFMKPCKNMLQLPFLLLYIPIFRYFIVNNDL